MEAIAIKKGIKVLKLKIGSHQMKSYPLFKETYESAFEVVPNVRKMRRLLGTENLRLFVQLMEYEKSLSLIEIPDTTVSDRISVIKSELHALRYSKALLYLLETELIGLE